MNTLKFSRFASSALVLLSLLTISASQARTTTNLALAVSFWYPTNGQTFTAPANIGLHAQVVDSNLVQTVQYFSGTTSLGVVTNTRAMMLTNWNTDSPFYMLWSNVPAGSYMLTAVATDAAHLTATSPLVNVTVLAPPPVRPAVYVYSPANGAMFLAPANLTLYARAVESAGVVQTVEFFAGSTSLDVVPNSSQGVFTNISTEPLFPLAWSNVLAGSYALKAVATDAHGMTATSSVVSISVVTNLPPPPVVRPSIYIYSPTNNARFVAPTNLTLYARAVETAGTVQTVEFFAGHASLGVVPNSSQVVVSNLSTAPLFPLTWSNVLAGSYALTAVATDARGITATSSVVNITVVTNLPPPPSVPFAIGFLYPTNGQTFTAPANVGVHAWVIDSNLVLTVQYFAGTTSIGIVTNTAGVMLTNTSAANPFFLLWSNVPAGSYALTAVAADSGGLRATSAPVNIYVVSPPPLSNRPPEVRITSPPNAASFRSPVNIPIYAYAHDPDGYVTSVEFRAGTSSLGFGGPIVRGTNTPPTSYYSNYFSLVWSNALPGSYALTAVVTDNSNAVTVSLPVNITVLPPSPPPPPSHPPTVIISATDPIAIEGTNCWVWSSLTNTVPTWTNWPGGTRVPLTNCGPKNATFSIYRSGDTNGDLTVAYSIGGTASNGVDYAALPGAVTIPAGQRLVMIPVVPIDEGPPDLNGTVILTLTPSTSRPVPVYLVGSPASAAALILDSPTPTPATSALADWTFHLNAAGPNGAWFHVEYTTDMLHWTPICTNQVVNGSVDFIDPNASTSQARFYRTVPEANPPQ
jgi:hypothetical protein